MTTNASPVLLRSRQAAVTGDACPPPGAVPKGLGIVVLCPVRSCWAESESGDGPRGVPGVMSAGGSDVSADFRAR
jgi:hypothetical protein